MNGDKNKKDNGYLVKNLYAYQKINLSLQLEESDNTVGKLQFSVSMIS